MKYGATNFPLKPVSEEIRALAPLGFDYLELCLDPPEASPEALAGRLAEIRAVADGEGLPILVGHLPAFIWLADVYPAIRRASVDEVKKALDVLAELGVTKAVLHPGYSTGLIRIVPGQAGGYSLDSLGLVLDHAEQTGVVICLENMFPKSGLFYRADEIDRVLAALPRVMMTFDLAHANIGARSGNILAVARAGTGRIRHVHLSDNSGAGDEHLPPGVGRADLAGGLRELKAMGYDETITLEVFAPDRDYLALSLKKTRRLWEGV